MRRVRGKATKAPAAVAGLLLTPFLFFAIASARSKSKGYYYLWRNDSKDLHLDTELDFKLSNLQIVGFESASKLKISLPPASLQYVHLRRVDPKQSCNCEITQRFALNPPKAGKLPTVSVPVTYSADTPEAELRAQTLKEGVCTDHGTQDPNGLLIFQYQWEFSGGVRTRTEDDAQKPPMQIDATHSSFFRFSLASTCQYVFLWQNESKDVIFHKELELDLKNLQIKGAEAGTSKYVVDLQPGEEKLMILTEVEPKQAYGVSMRAGFSLQKMKQ